MALVPKSGVRSEADSSDSSEDELTHARKILQNKIIEDSDVSSDPPSLGSSLENLHLLSDNEEEGLVSVIDLQVPTPAYVGPPADSPSILESIHAVLLPTTPVLNSPGLCNSPQCSPASTISVNTPAGRDTRSKKRTFVVKKKLVRVKRIDTKWTCKKEFRGRADIEDKVFPPVLQTRSPLEYFQMFFDDDLIELIAHQTNLYHMQTNGTTLNVTADEIKDFLAIHLIMGVVNLPAYTDYWSKMLRYNKVADVMPMKRFQKIRRYIHFADNLQDDGDRYYKIRPLLESIRRNCLKVDEETRHSIDEMMVPYKGTRAGSRKQYIKNKPRKWGFKIFVRAGVSGIVYDMLPYGGEDTFRNLQFTDEENAMGLGAKVVIALSQTIKQKPCSVLYFDNFFTSLELLQHLRTEYGIFALGTVRQNRLRGAQSKLPTDKILKKKGRGSSAQVVSNDANISIVKWFDNKCVIAASTYTDSHPVQQVLRYCKNTKSRSPVPCPNIIKEYNGSMGGVDLADMLVALYRTEMRSHRWYMPICSQLLDICVNNAWLLYRRELENKNYMKLKDFRCAISQDLLSFERTLKTGNTSRGSYFVAPQTSESARFDHVGHMPSFSTKGRCKKCIKNQTKFICVKCNVRLCLVEGRNCFNDYHTPPN